MNELTTSINDIFVGNGLTIVISCFVIGSIVKGSFSFIPNKLIPFINIVVAEILGFVIPDTFVDRDVISKVILLAFIGLSSVGLYESITTVIKKRFSVDLPKIFLRIFGKEDDEVLSKLAEDASEALATTLDSGDESTDEAQNDESEETGTDDDQ
jgi:hypothetical protein